MVIFFATACTIALVYKDIEKIMRIVIAISSVPTLFGILSLLVATSALDEERENSDKLFKDMKQQEKYELIQEPVYRKIK